MNTNMLKGLIGCAGMTQEQLADKMGVSLSRFNAKVNERGGAEFDLSELKALKEILGMNSRQVYEVFFQ